MWKMLYDTHVHGDHVYSRNGRSEHGGACGTRVALNRRGLMYGYEITLLGIAVLINSGRVKP